MTKPTPQFSMNEVERLLEQVEEERQEQRTWFTNRELADRAGVSMAVMLDRIHKLIDAGVVRCVGKRMFVSKYTGTVHPTYGYEIIKQPEEEAK